MNKSKSNWNNVKKLQDNKIDYSDNPELTSDDIKNMYFMPKDEFLQSIKPSQASNNLIILRNHIQELCDTYSITYPIKIVAVSKTVSINNIFELYNSADQTSFAENYVKDFSNKVEGFNKLLANFKLHKTHSNNVDKSYLAHYNHEIEWHFIGNIQSNKIKEISQKSSWVQSLEKIKHAELLNINRIPSQPKLNVLIEVNISSEPNKHGLQSIDEIILLADSVKQLPNITLRGLMGVASNTTDECIIHQQFSYLKSLYDKLNNSYDLDILSMGMSHDYHIAIECGANMLRIGSKIFGERNYDI
jgi:PLP dependent protein